MYLRINFLIEEHIGISISLLITSKALIFHVILDVPFANSSIIKLEPFLSNFYIWVVVATLCISRVYDYSTKFVLVIVVRLFFTWNGILGKLQLHGKLKVIINLMSCHRLKVPIKPFESDNQKRRKLIKICLAWSTNLFMKKFRVIHVISF